MKPHFRKVDGQWRLYGSRKHARSQPWRWFNLWSNVPFSMWHEYEEMKNVIDEYRQAAINVYERKPPK